MKRIQVNKAPHRPRFVLIAKCADLADCRCRTDFRTFATINAFSRINFCQRRPLHADCAGRAYFYALRAADAAEIAVLLR